MVGKVNDVWHADIHFLDLKGEKRYLFSIINDVSRFIVHYAIIPRKSSTKHVEIVYTARRSFIGRTIVARIRVPK